MLTLALGNYRKLLEDVGHHAAIVIGADLENEHIRSFTSYGNLRLQEFLESWDWPEWSVTEERAFRTIWKANRQFYRVPAEGQPNECFYIADGNYYAVLPTATQEPPLGTLPTNTTYFVPLVLTERYIEPNQACQRSLGTVFGVYGTKPNASSSSCCATRGLPFRISERGIDVQTGASTVWVHHSLAIPEFSAEPYDVARSYKKGEVMIWTDGNCYLAVSDLSGQAPNASQLWRKVPLPRFAVPYLTYAIAADAEDDAKAAAKFETQAQLYLGRQIDKRTQQGQRAHYQMTPGRSGWYCGYYFPCWGSTAPVTTLSDTCVDEWGNPIVIPGPGGGPGPDVPPSAEFLEVIDRLRGAPTALESLASIARRTLAIVEIVWGDPRSESIWQLMLGTADPLYPEDQVQPLDHDPVTNNRFWQKVGGH